MISVVFDLEMWMMANSLRVAYPILWSQQHKGHWESKLLAYWASLQASHVEPGEMDCS